MLRLLTSVKLVSSPSLMIVLLLLALCTTSARAETLQRTLPPVEIDSHVEYAYDVRSTASDIPYNIFGVYVQDGNFSVSDTDEPPMWRHVDAVNTWKFQHMVVTEMNARAQPRTHTHTHTSARSSARTE